MTPKNLSYYDSQEHVRKIREFQSVSPMQQVSEEFGNFIERKMNGKLFRLHSNANAREESSEFLRGDSCDSFMIFLIV